MQPAISLPHFDPSSPVAVVTVDLSGASTKGFGNELPPVLTGFFRCGNTLFHSTLDGFLLQMIYQMQPGMERTTDYALASRPDELIVLDLLSFLSAYPFSSFLTVRNTAGCYECFADVPSAEFGPIPERASLHIEDQDVTAALNTLLNRLDGPDRTPLVSLLEYYRKGLYMLRECAEAASNLYYEEAFLRFFQILELLGELHTPSLENSIRRRVLDGFEALCRDLDLGAEDWVTTRRSRLKEQFALNEIPVAIKIRHALRALRLGDPLISYYTGRLIKLRNAIAHGRSLPPPQGDPLYASAFFGHAPDLLASELEALPALARCAIARHLGLKLSFNNDWPQARRSLIPPRSYIDSLGDRPRRYASLIRQNGFNLTYGHLFESYALIGYPKTLGRLSKLLGPYFLDESLAPPQLEHMFEIAVNLADSPDDAVRDRARQIVELCLADEDYVPFYLRDLCLKLRHLKEPLCWLPAYLRTRKAPVT